jgi:hypothetical protein
METNYVTPATVAPVQLAPAPIARLDIDAVTRDTFAANNAALTGYLRQIAPLPSWRTGNDCTIDAEPRGVAAPHESHERSNRYRWTLLAIVALSIVATGGLAFTGHELGMIANVGLTVAVWIGAGGSLAIYLVQRLQAHDLEHSPEAIALVREHAAAYATETGADAQAGLTAAYADTLRIQAQAHAATVQAQAAALDAQVQRLMLPPMASQPRRVTVAGSAQPQAWEWDTNGNPVLLPEGDNTPVPPVCPPLSPPVPTGVDPTVAQMLEWVASLYDAPDRVHPDTRRIINTELPWSARSKALPETEKPRVKAAMVSTGLFAPLPGNGLALECTIKGVALRKVREVLR